MASVNSTTSANRLTGLATGLDIDSMIKTQMSAYESKVNSVIQQKDVVEIRQKLYRDILSDTRNFYNKYLDPLSKDSILLSSAYKSVKFTSSDDSIVSVTSNAEAKVDSYTVTGKVATAAKAKFDGKIEVDEKIVINGKEFTMKGENPTEIAKNLNNDLKTAGLDVQVKYTKFAGTESTDVSNNKDALIIESTVLGEKSNLEVNGNVSIGSTVQGIDGAKATLTGISINDIKNALGNISIGSTPINLDISKTDAEILSELNNKLSANSSQFTASVDTYGNITFTAKTNGSSIAEPAIDVGGKKGAFKQGLDATITTTTIESKDLNESNSIKINDKTIISNDKKLSELSTDEWNQLLADSGVSGVSAELKAGKIVFTATGSGKDKDVNISLPSDKTSVAVTKGEDARIIVKNSSGGVYTHTGGSNTVTLDGVTFKFNGTLPTDEDKAIKIIGKVDVTETKDKIVSFINDYNTLMEKLNKTVNTKHDRDYVPLTSEQKEQMSDKEIELWEAKVENGQLYKDSDITRIMNSMKQTMRTVMSSSGFKLKDMGITPVEDYSGSKNGTFTIDEDKLTEALENNMDDVLNLFTSNPKITTDTNGTTNKGILYQLKDTLYSEVMKSDSILSKKVGIEGTSTFTNNTLTKNISDYETKIKKMQKDLATREQSLYSKYATLETIMNKYNSQQSYLTSYLGN